MKLIIFLLCQSLLWANTVWFVSSQNVETFARVTGVSNKGADIDSYFQMYSGRHLELETGHYFVQVRHPNIQGTQSFSGVFVQYIVKEVQNNKLITKAVTMQYPVNTIEFYVREKEERINIEIPIYQKFIEERLINSSLAAN